MALAREYPVNSVAAQRSAAEAVDVSAIPASSTGRTKSNPSPVPSAISNCASERVAHLSQISGKISLMD
jgi:hypothetical protein